MRLRSFFLSLSALILAPIPPLCGPGVFAQTPPASQPILPPTVRVYSREVLLYVDVTDNKGNPVHDLTRNDFTVVENNRTITPRSFREHRSDQQAPAPVAESPALPSLPANTFTNEAPPEGPLPLTILLLDSLDTPIANQVLLDKQISEFAGRLRPGARVAIFTLSGTGELSLLQGFTSDPQQLKRAARNVKTQVPALEDSGQDPNNANAGDSNALADPTQPPKVSLQEPAVDLNIECNHAAMRVRYTSAAFGEIARFVAGMPGRKNLIWFSGVFPMGMRDKQGSQCYNANEDLISADDLLERAHVVVYPVDPRALDLIARYGSQSRIVHLQAAEHLTMERIAEQTGGKAFYNTNDLAAAATQALGAGLDYYAITYTPINQNRDTRARNISVTVDKPGLTLVYKRRYNAYPPEMPTTPNGRPYATTTPAQSALMRGTPQPTEILFQVSVAPAASTDSTPAPGNTPVPKAMKPPYRRLTLSYNLDLSGIQFDQAADGNYHGQFEYAVNVYDADNGKLLNSSDMGAKPTLPPAVYQSMLASGTRLRQDIDIPAKGPCVLRVVIHDLTTGHLGAVEIPTSAVTP